MNHLGSRILIPFFRSVALSRIMHLLFATTFASHCYISIALHCAFAIVCTSLACCIFNYTFMDRCSSFVTTFSSLASFCIVFSSTKCCSSTSFSFDSSIRTRSTNVTLGPVYFLACQCCLLLRKISTKDVPIVSMS